jgi:hypothetical protein
MRRHFWTLTFLVTLLCACAVQSSAAEKDAAADTGTEEQQAGVLAAAKAVASSFDAGKYVEAWAMVGPSLSAKSTQDEFAGYVSTLRATLGAPGKRTVKGFGFPAAMEGLPQGQYGLIAVETDFANAKAVEEKFVFEFVGGKWRLIGYWLAKEVTIGAAGMPNNSFKPKLLRGSA